MNFLLFKNITKVHIHIYIVIYADETKTGTYIIKHKGFFKRWAIVVNSEDEAIKKGIEHIGKPYEIDKDDSHCFKPDPFALLIHGTQKKGYFKNLK